MIDIENCLDHFCKLSVKSLFLSPPAEIVQLRNWADICSKGIFAGLIFGGAYFRRGQERIFNSLLEGLIVGRNFAFQNGFDFTMKTASTNSPWAYNLLRRAYYQKDICV